MNALKSFKEKNTWIWALLGSLIMWAAIGIILAEYEPGKLDSERLFRLFPGDSRIGADDGGDYGRRRDRPVYPRGDNTGRLPERYRDRRERSHGGAGDIAHYWAWALRWGSQQPVGRFPANTAHDSDNGHELYTVNCFADVQLLMGLEKLSMSEACWA